MTHLLFEAVLDAVPALPSARATIVTDCLSNMERDSLEQAALLAAAPPIALPEARLEAWSTTESVRAHVTEVPAEAVATTEGNGVDS